MTHTTVKATIFRYNPDTDAAPTYQTYEVPWTEKGLVIQLLKTIYVDIDRTLAFRYYACGHKVCNGCMMKINGKPTHACFTFVLPGDELRIEPMPGYPIIRDLVVDFGRRVGPYEIRRGAVIRKVEG